MMDKLIQRKPKKHSAKFQKVALILVAVIATAWLGRSYVSASSMGVAVDSLVLGKVSEGSFKVNVRGPGIFVPTVIRWQVAQVDGFVERVLVKPGEHVEPNDIIMELSNPQLLQELEQLEWDFEAGKAEIEAQMIKLEASLVEQKLVYQDAHDNYLSAKMFFDAETKLRTENTSSLSLLNYKKTEREMNSAYRRWQSEVQRFEKVKQSIVAEKTALTARLNKTEKKRDKMREQVEQLTVRAGMPAIIQAMPFETGQRVSIGDPLTKLAKHDDLYAELQIPEIQISKVEVGQLAILDTRKNTIRGTVSRIDPAVKNGSVTVDVKISETLPSDARPDLSIEGTVVVADIANTLSVNRPLFAQSGSNAQVFKVSRDGTTAIRTPVTFGQGASDRIEVIAGLQSGDKIVISDTSAWDHNTSININ